MGAIFRRAQDIYTAAHDMANEIGPLRTGSASDTIPCAILVSGSGSGMQAMVIHKQTHLDCGHRTELVISDNPEATGLMKAEILGISAHCIALPQEADRTLRRHLHEQQIQSLLQEHQRFLV